MAATGCWQGGGGDVTQVRLVYPPSAADQVQLLETPTVISPLFPPLPNDKCFFCVCFCCLKAANWAKAEFRVKNSVKNTLSVLLQAH